MGHGGVGDVAEVSAHPSAICRGESIGERAKLSRAGQEAGQDGEVGDAVSGHGRLGRLG
jgi:hypothetical protein